MFSLGLADNTTAGGLETLLNVSLNVAGSYFARISGLDDTIQLYQLELSTVAVPEANGFALLGVCAGARRRLRRRR